MATAQVRASSVYVPILRVDKQKREVEGFCFVNEVVSGEGGVRLKRKAMEAASEDYMKWGAVRAMHGDVAAGTAKLLEWNDQGCYLRAKIVDDNEWRKCEEGVYKGFSVGVVPEVMRGLDVEQCCWIENSLVDRPKDPDARLSIARADGITEDAATRTYPVEMLPTAKEQKRAAKLERQAAASAESSAADPNAAASTSAPTPPAPDSIQRAETRFTAIERRLEAVDALKATVDELTRVVEKQSKRIKRLMEMPAQGRAVLPPVIHSQAFERTFAANEIGDLLSNDGGRGDAAMALRRQYDALIVRAADAGKLSEEDRQGLAFQINSVKASLGLLGVSV